MLLLYRFGETASDKVVNEVPVSEVPVTKELLFKTKDDEFSKQYCEQKSDDLNVANM